MKAGARESLGDTSSADVVELVVAELQARRKYMQHLIHLVDEQEGKEYVAMRRTARRSGIKLQSDVVTAGAKRTPKTPMSMGGQRQ
jgi:hypothetical protein